MKKSTLSHHAPTVAIQGEIASFHDEAAHLLLDHKQISLLPKINFADVFVAVDSGEATYGVCATHNVIYGDITQTMQLIKKYDVTILKTVELPIQQCLISLPGATINQITDIYSHPIALIQAKTYLSAHLPDATIHTHHDTAGSVRDIAEWQNPSKAAIASKYAAHYYKMQVLAANIQSDESNFTRFVLFCKK